MVRLNKASFFIIILLVLGTLCCKKEDIPKIKPNYITKGCLPKKVYGTNALGDSSSEFYYLNNVLIKIKDTDLIYNDDGLLYKKHYKASSFQYYLEYQYDNTSRLINILLYRDENLNNCYKMHRNSSIHYNENNQIDLVSKYYLKFNTSNTYRTSTKKYTFYEGSNNIEGLKSYNYDDILVSETFYDYDTLNYVTKNLNLPSDKTSPDNNIIKIRQINHFDTFSNFIYYYDFEYNEWGFPSKKIGSSSFQSVSNYEYINCE